MGFLRPSTLFMLPITYAWFRWLPCQSWGFLQWPGLKEFLLFLLVSITFSNFSYVPSSSMKPTIRLGDWIIIQRFSYYLTSPAVHDIVAFPVPDPTKEIFLKRIVAIEGDWVKVENNCLYVNEIAQEEEDFIAEPPNYTLGSTSFQNFAMLAVPRAEVVINHKEGQFVPRGHVFVLGDNRNHSYDSHVWGPLSVEKIIGRYAMCYHRPSESRLNDIESAEDIV
ncbi:chloroplast processing peptidase [Fagus crenata]